jgi:hypothetical protein
VKPPRGEEETWARRLDVHGAVNLDTGQWLWPWRGKETRGRRVPCARSTKIGVVALRASQSREAEKHPGSVGSVTVRWAPAAQ